GDRTPQFAQGYFVYDSKKSGAVTVSHLRFAPEPIRAPYLIDEADFVACHQFDLLDRYEVLASARRGATLLLNCPHPAHLAWDHLSDDVQRAIVERELVVYLIDAHAIAGEHGLGGRINTVMQACF